MPRAAAKKTASSATELAADTQGASDVSEQLDHDVPVHVAWVRVMADLRALGKDQLHDSPGAKFKFRGIDDLMNAVGPLLRKHQVVVLPSVQSAAYRDVQTSSGKPAREVTVQVEFTVIGPRGDTMAGSTPGEAMDNGDKGTAKAMSVAYRIFLLQSLTLPTNDIDPDAEAFQRSSGPTAQQQAQQVANGLPTATDTTRVHAVREWADVRNLLGFTVESQDGSVQPLGRLIDQRIDELDPAARQAREDQAAASFGRSDAEPNADHTED